MVHDAAVVSLATTAYGPRLERLAESLDRVRFEGERLLWRPGSFPAGCPEQLVSPFAFKPFALDEARRSGVRFALWLDAGCVAIRSLAPIFRRIEVEGHVLFRNGSFRIGEWASDLALELHDLDREQALALPEVNAAAIGLDLEHPRSVAFLERWLDAARDGRAFRGVAEPVRSAEEYGAVAANIGGRASRDPRVRGHRHDQTVAGILAQELGMELAPEGLQSFARIRRLRPSTVLVNCRAGRRLDRPLLRLARVAGYAPAVRPGR